MKAVTWTAQTHEGLVDANHLWFVTDQFGNVLASGLTEVTARTIASAPALVEALLAARRVLVEDEHYRTFNPVVKMCDTALQQAGAL